MNMVQNENMLPTFTSNGHEILPRNLSPCHPQRIPKMLSFQIKKTFSLEKTKRLDTFPEMLTTFVGPDLFFKLPWEALCFV